MHSLFNFMPIDLFQFWWKRSIADCIFACSQQVNRYFSAEQKRRDIKWDFSATSSYLSNWAGVWKDTRPPGLQNINIRGKKIIPLCKNKGMMTEWLLSICWEFKVWILSSNKTIQTQTRNASAPKRSLLWCGPAGSRWSLAVKGLTAQLLNELRSSFINCQSRCQRSHAEENKAHACLRGHTETHKVANKLTDVASLSAPCSTDIRTVQLGLTVSDTRNNLTTDKNWNDNLKDYTFMISWHKKRKQVPH